MKVSGRTDNLFNEVTQELRKGVSEKGHPFRTFVLGTTGLEKMARLRTIVLRELSDDLELCFYTDYRSKKIMHIKENKRVGLLFYHPEKRIQVKIEGLAQIVSSASEVKEQWEKLSQVAQKDYTTSRAPGSEMEDSERLEFLSERNYFCKVHVKPHKIEYLKLQSPEHLRVRFSSNEGLWNGEFLIP